MAHDQIRIVLAEPKHKDGILRLLRDSFLPRSPLWAVLNIRWEEVKDGYEKMVNEALADPVSFVAIDETNPRNKIIGCRLSKLIDFTNPGDPDEDFIFVPSANRKVYAITQVHNQLMRGWKREFIRDGAKKVLEFIVLCVEDSYGGHGVAQKLIERSMELAKQIGVDYVFAVAANWKAQRVFEKLHFEIRRTLEYAQALDPSTGKPYAIPEDGSASVQWVVKKIGKPQAQL